MRSKLILVLALVMGGVTTFFFYQYMDSYEAQTVSDEQMIEVVIASQTIDRNELVTRDMLHTVHVPEQAVHPAAIRNIDDAAGKFATARLESGEHILSHRLLDEQDETLFVSYKVQEGYRAVSIGVNLVRSVTQLIEPEDKVDVIFTEFGLEDMAGTAEDVDVEEETQPAAVNREVRSELLLEDVRVLAVGRRITERTSEDGFTEYSAVTLELTPEDAVALVNASERGQLQLMLRSKVQSGAEEA